MALTLKDIRAALKKACPGCVRFEIGIRPSKTGFQSMDQREWVEDSDLADIRELKDVLDDLRKGGVFDVYCYNREELVTNADLVIHKTKGVLDCFDSVGGAAEHRRSAEWLKADLG